MIRLLRRGFTMIELIVVILVLGLLVNLAVLKYIDLTRSAYSAKIAGDFTAVRLAAYNYEADHNNQWPADVGPGTIPPEMIPYLPPNFQWVTPNYTLDWDNNTPATSPYALAISMVSDDDRLMQVLRNALGTRAPYFFAGNRLTFVLVDESGNY